MLRGRGLLLCFGRVGVLDEWEGDALATVSSEAGCSLRYSHLDRVGLARIVATFGGGGYWRWVHDRVDVAESQDRALLGRLRAGVLRARGVGALRVGTPIFLEVQCPRQTVLEPLAPLHLHILLEALLLHLLLLLQCFHPLLIALATLYRSFKFEDGQCGGGFQPLVPQDPSAVLLL